ncbi:hypothetical protein JXA85_03280 [Candidatus Woesearchaeota archaeon]|nr:hypothetical protein [Candidatus Woesearchaeota archaeon]
MADKDLDDRLKEDKKEEKPKVDNKQSLEDVVNNGGHFKLANGANIYSKNHKKSNPVWYYFGQLTSLPEKIISTDFKAGTQPTYKSVNLTAKVIESEPSLQNLDVFTGNNSVKYELKKLWTDPYIKKTRGFLTRLVGTPFVLLGGLAQKITRSGYYNAWSNVLVTQTPREAAQLDAVGMAHYIENKKYKLLPCLATELKFWPFMKLYSAKYANKHLPPHMRSQTGRFLFPLMGAAATAVPGIRIPVYYGAAAGLATGYVYNKVAEAFKTGFPKFFDKYDELRTAYEKKKEKKQREKYEKRMKDYVPENRAMNR